MLRTRFPRLSHVGGIILSPFYRIQFFLQPHPDRRVLEEVVFPALLEDESVRRVLFVGCAWYTRHYAKHFPRREFWTIDVDHRARRYGAPHHIVGSFTNLRSYFDPESLDAIICNGVIGFGLDTREEAERAFSECYTALRPGGVFVIGWDDVEQFRPFSVDDLRSLHSFQRYDLPPFTSWRYPTFSHLRHTFDFYRKPHSLPPNGMACS